MIIKQTRVITGDANKLGIYLSSAGENEKVQHIAGWIDSLRTSDAIAALWGRTYSIRHFIVSPSKKLTTKQLGDVIKEIGTEFDVPESSMERMTVVMHEKPRSDANDGARYHYHVAIPEVDADTGRVLSSSFTKMRNEKLARLSELRLGHDVVPGKFNREVYEALRSYKIDLQPFEDALRAACRDEGIPEARWLDYRARAAFSESQIHAAERLARERGETRFTSPQVVRQHIRDLMKDKALPEVLDTLLEQGFSVEPGRKAGTWILTKDDIEFGSLDRLTKLKKDIVNEEAERRFGPKEIWAGTRPDASGRAGDPRYSQRNSGASGRTGGRRGQTIDQRADTGSSRRDVDQAGQDGRDPEAPFGTGPVQNRTAQPALGRDEKPKLDPRKLGQELRRDEALRGRRLAYQERLARLGDATERGRHRANIMSQANDLVRSSAVGDGEYIGIDGEGFQAIAAFFRRWAAQQAKSMRP